jgi:hypothetical protein
MEAKMPYEKGPVMSGSRLEDLDLSQARLHAPNFDGTKITDATFIGADISGDIDGLRINGVEIAPLIQAELERREPDRVLLRASDPPGLVEAWIMIERMWQPTFERALALPEETLHRRVDDEWSFVETQRHLVMAADCWLRRMVKGAEHPYHPWGLAGSWLADPAAWGLDTAARPSAAEVLALRRERMAEVAATIANQTDGELARICQPPATPGHPNRPVSVGHCLSVILNEEWEHHLYTVRDLDVLTAT